MKYSGTSQIYRNSEKYRDLIKDNNFYYLYKHVSLDSSLSTLGIFNNHELRYNYPIAFNDPYDCHFNLTLDYSNISREDVSSLFDIDIPPSDWIYVKQYFLHKMGLMPQFINNSFKHLREETLITCFNSNPLSILMWSHYANQHTGFMIEFKIPLNESIFLPLPIRYTNEYPDIKLSFSEFQDILHNSEENKDLIYKTATSIFFQKSKEWAYEKEFRLIGNPNWKSKEQIDPRLLKFDPKFISSITLGLNFNKDYLVHIQSAVSDFNERNNTTVEIFNTSLVKGMYKLEVSNHPRLDKSKP
ncbi:hypothetical protein B9T31_15985 [Acinetobacter sp. ANC 4558]|uniref:DUF2971 domain-containing protein n=1 Tax=Acinetobacter sp. ANC 4558 TaxID=1977876 RepID=UPI000A32FC4D|nr:DUF2971 domain-containing protein [Acinetobacter sp. ANC 4558]OTG80798.1 hypothetical protein B9T31_15985 [Acinetobacter sp. ANC 4558]